MRFHLDDGLGFVIAGEEAEGEEGDDEHGSDAPCGAEGGAADAGFLFGDEDVDVAEDGGELGAFFVGEFPLLRRGVGGGFGFLEEGVEGAGAVEEELELGGFRDEGFEFGDFERGRLTENPRGDAGFELVIRVDGEG